MIGEFFDCIADKNKKYYRVIHTIKEYNDGRRFPIDELVVADQKVDLQATDRTKLGGFCISTYEYVFRWLIRGDTLCEVKIPDDTEIYKTVSDNGIYIAEKMILTNPRKVDDKFAMELYLNSTLPEISYFKAMTACAICGYINTAMKVCEDKVNKENVDIAITELEDFCTRRGQEKYIDNALANESLKKLYDRLKEIQIKNKMEI